jgi:hypothetical protein
MPLGEEGDFRTIGFMMKNLFPGQDHMGGPGSAMLHQWTQPSGGTNMSRPVPPLTDAALTFPNITFPGITFPNQLPPITISGFGGGGGTATSTVKVFGPAGSTTTSPTDATQILFEGTALVDVAVAGSNAVVTFDASGSVGSTLKYGRITSVSQPSASFAIWEYSITEYAAGSPTATTYTARNLLEWNNSTTFAYGYAITAGNRLTTVPASSFYISPVPVGTMVQLENTSAVSPGGYWFSAPNPITGGC